MRQGFIVGMSELKNKTMKRELATELLMSNEYIGYIDIWEDTARCFIFTSKDGADAVLRSAKQIGYETAGAIEEGIYIKNSELERPHLSRIRNHHTFMKELYK